MYYGGVEHEIRKEVWPFLLGHYKFGMGKKDMTQVQTESSMITKMNRCTLHQCNKVGSVLFSQIGVTCHIFPIEHLSF